MKWNLFGMLVLCGATAAACKVSVVDDATGGAGGSGSTTSAKAATSTGSKTTGTTVAGSTGSGTLACDDGTASTIDSAACQACQQCALGDACAADLSTLNADPNATAWEDCVFPNTMANPPTPGCPKDDPSTPGVNEFTVCTDACAAMYPGVQEKYLAVASCAICQECPNNCDAATQCTGG